MRRLLALLLFAGLLAGSATAQSFVPASTTAPAPEGALYYVIKKSALVYTMPDSGRAYLQLGFRDPVFVSERTGKWSRIRTEDGARGYVETEKLSNIWIRVSKRQKAVFLYEGTDLVMRVPADFGYNAVSDKERRGSRTNPDHWRTPEGVFTVVKKNPYSKFYKAFVLNYPNAEDAERGLSQGLITREQYHAIVRAADSFSMPPMSTALGGMIEIHGDGTGGGTNWTQGCVAVHNDHMDDLWAWVEVGTPVLVER